MTSLLARLLMIVAVALVPVLGFQIYSETQTRTVRLQLIEDEAMRLLRLVSGEQQRIIDGAEQVLDVIAGSPAVQEKMPDLCNRLLTGLLNQTPRYNYAGVIALDGSALCAPTPLNRVSNVSDRSFFRAALESGRFVAGEYTIGRTSREPTIHLAKPARDSKGDIIAVVDVGLSLKWLNDEIGKLDMPAGGIVTVTDRNGTILARRPGGMAFVGQPIPPTGPLHAGGRPGPGGFDPHQPGRRPAGHCRLRPARCGSLGDQRPASAWMREPRSPAPRGRT